MITETLQPLSSPAGELAPKLHAEPPELIIGPPKGWTGLGWEELVRYRELLYFMVWRDLTVRYKQTVLGFAWAVLQPTFQMVVFTIIFGRLAKLDSEGFPYAVYFIVGQLPWLFFSTGVTTAAGSLVGQQHLLTKVYFPRLFVPTSAIGTCLVDFIIGTFICASVLAYFHITPSWQVVLVPGLLFVVTLATLGMGYLWAALTVTFRDLKFVINFFMQALMYLSPVVYAVTIIPERFRPLAAVNPMFGLLDAFRSAVLGKPWNFQTLTVSIVSSVALFAFGIYYFRRTEARFADIA